MSQAKIKDSIMAAEEYTREPPRPLRKAPATPERYPVEALGNTLSSAAKAIQEKIQAPVEICAQSVLSAASLAVQAHADVVMPFGQKRPLSLFLVSVAATGERKTSSDEEAMQPVTEREKELREDYDRLHELWQNDNAAWEQERKNILTKKAGAQGYENRRNALNVLGAAPRAPLMPMLTCPEPTFEGLCKLLLIGQPSVGVFSAEGGQFIGGHGMSDDNKLKTAAAICTMWDAKPIKRVRQGDGTIIMPGRRVAMHLMAQPDVANKLLSDPALADQGLLSRLLVTAPQTTAGTRFYKAFSTHSEQALRKYQQAILDILHTPLPLAEGKQNELAPRSLPLSGEASRVLIGFSDHVEGLIAPGGKLEPVRGFANKLPEHAARLAGVLALVEDIHLRELSEHHIAAGIALAEYYASEALRLFGESRVSRDILLAEKLLRWLHRSWDLEIVSLPDIYQRSINAISDKRTASAVVATLEDHGWLVQVPGGGDIRGTRRKDVWKITKG